MDTMPMKYLLNDINVIVEDRPELVRADLKQMGYRPDYCRFILNYISDLTGIMMVYGSDSLCENGLAELLIDENTIPLPNMNHLESQIQEMKNDLIEQIEAFFYNKCITMIRVRPFFLKEAPIMIKWIGLGGLIDKEGDFYEFPDLPVENLSRAIKRLQEWVAISEEEIIVYRN